MMGRLRVVVAVGLVLALHLYVKWHQGQPDDEAGQFQLQMPGSTASDPLRGLP